MKEVARHCGGTHEVLGRSRGSDESALQVLRLLVPASELNRDTRAILVLLVRITCKDYIFIHPSSDKTEITFAI
jgi:hypothetical protein